MKSTDKSLKSALDLAMERLAQRDGAPARLTDAQKTALAEVDCKTKAKLAEREILGSDRLAKAGGEMCNDVLFFDQHGNRSSLAGKL